MYHSQKTLDGKPQVYSNGASNFPESRSYYTSSNPSASRPRLTRHFIACRAISLAMWPSSSSSFLQVRTYPSPELLCSSHSEPPFVFVSFSVCKNRLTDLQHGQTTLRVSSSPAFSVAVHRLSVSTSSAVPSRISGKEPKTEVCPCPSSV